MTNLFGLVAFTSFRYKYLLAGIYGWRWWTKVGPWVTFTDVIVIDWQRSDRGEDNNIPSQVVMSFIGKVEWVKQCIRYFGIINRWYSGGVIFGEIISPIVYSSFPFKLYSFLKKYVRLSNGISYPKFFICQFYKTSEDALRFDIVSDGLGYFGGLLM